MHNHEKCVHELKFCGNCDVVYCEKCKEEWKKNWSSVTYSTPNYPLGGGVVLCSSGTGGVCEH